MNLLKFLQAQGFGSRKACRWLLRGGLVCVNGEMCRDETADASAVRELAIDGETQWLIPQPFFYLLMNKPAGYEVSQRPRDYPSVFALLPERVRAVGVQAVGRLDADTTGVLLFTNDGAFNHRMTSPKQHVAKHYRATLKHPAAPDLCANLVRGVLLHDDEETVSARSAETADAHTLKLCITQGRYHQVKRMVAAAGNRVAALHRERFHIWDAQGLAAGQWRFVAPENGTDG
ncbi:16S rRNA pseudouridine(516) synthase [Conchiformibius kuhniae]|uniref:Pseudouridine synthase n=1 Tax=Conchiformibius kuhniae TaxID=211502 RepID=A0ABD8B8J3_9NEIS|nr:16S rRNA pseudouridine(516) synthase [Conchiformibius kuhniae]